MNLLPASPDGEACRLCRHWQTQIAQDVMINTATGQQLTPAQSEAMTIKERIASVRKMKTAPCCEGPAWQATTAEMWCGRFSARVQQ
jgi:hypothetical protein